MGATYPTVTAAALAALAAAVSCLLSPRPPPPPPPRLPRHFSSRGAAKRHGGGPGRSVRLLVAENVDEYRLAVATAVRGDDAVLEIGCHEGMTAHLLSECCGAAGLVVGVDKSETWIGRARQRFPSIRFEQLDGFDMRALLRLQQQLGRAFDVLFVDVSGSRELRSLIPLLEALECALSPRLIVVKSFRLARLRLRMEGVAEGPGDGAAAARLGMLERAMRTMQAQRRQGRQGQASRGGDAASEPLAPPSDPPQTAASSPPSTTGRPREGLSAATEELAEWSARCRECGVAKGRKSFSGKQQRRADLAAEAGGGSGGQCKECVARSRGRRVA